MGKPPEAGNNITMLACIVERLALEILESGRAFGILTLADLYATLLSCQVFRMLQGQVKETPLDETHLAIHTALDGVQSQTLSACITREGTGPAAMDVPGKLVEDNMRTPEQ